MDRRTKDWWKRKAFQWWIAPNVPKTPGSIRQISQDIVETRDYGRQICEDLDPSTVQERIEDRGEEMQAKVVGIRTAHRIAKFLIG